METRSGGHHGGTWPSFAWVVAEPPTRSMGLLIHSHRRRDRGHRNLGAASRGSASFEKMFGDNAAKEIRMRSVAAKDGIGAALAAIKGIAEA